MAENTLGRRERMMLIEFIEKWVDLSGVCDAMVDGQLSQLLFQCLSDGWDEPLANQIIQSCRDAPGGIVTYEELMAYQLPPRQEISLLATDGITLGQNIPFDICHFPSAALAQWIQSYRQIAPYVQIPIDDVCRHIVVVGMSGTGKTFVGMNAAVEIHRTGVPLHIFDPKFDYRALVHHIDDLLVLRADQVLINPLRPPPNVSKTRWAGYLAFALSGQRLIDSLYPLQEAILNCYQHYDTPDFDNLCDELARIFVQSSTFKSGEVHYKREVVLTAIAALRAMKNNFESVFSVKKGFMHEIADRSVVFEIADMVVMPTLLPNLLFWWQYAYRLHNLQKGGRLRICMMIDEAHQYIFSEAYAQQVRLATGTAPISVIIDRCRDLGMGIIALSQRPSEMNQTLMSAAATKIYLTVDGIQDQRYAVENLDLSDEQKAVFQRMTPRQAIVKRSSGYTQPLTIETVTFDRGEIPSDEEIDRLMAGRIEALVKTCEFIHPINPSTSTSPSVSPKTVKSPDADPSMSVSPTVDASPVTDAPTAGASRHPQVETKNSEANQIESLADVVGQRFKTAREIKIAHGIIHDIWERPLAYTTTHSRIADFCQRNPEWTLPATNRVVTRLCNEKHPDDYGILRKVDIAVAGRGKPKILDFTPKGRKLIIASKGSAYGVSLPRGGVLHGLYVASAATYYQNQGAQTIIGDTRLKASQEVDVGIWWEQPPPKDLPQRIAFEVVMTDIDYIFRKNDAEGDDGHRVSRYPFIEARLDSDYYDHLFIGCVSDEMEIQVKRRIGNLPKELRSNVLCVRLESYLKDTKT